MRVLAREGRLVCVVYRVLRIPHGWPRNARTNMHVPLRKGDFDPGGFERLKQGEVQSALDLPMTGVANIHPDQQLKVQRTLAKFGEPYFRLRLWFHMRTGPRYGY